jgi:hypothetical protein
MAFPFIGRCQLLGVASIGRCHGLAAAAPGQAQGRGPGAGPFRAPFLAIALPGAAAARQGPGPGKHDVYFLGGGGGGGRSCDVYLCCPMAACRQPQGFDLGVPHPSPPHPTLAFSRIVDSLSFS